MKEYHKIQTVFDRDPDTKFRTVILGAWSRREFEYLKDAEWEFTEKVDGTNIRIHFDGKNVRFGGKTERAQIPTFLLSVLMDAFPASSFASFDSAVTLYGEGYGHKIQKVGSKYLEGESSFILFDVQIGDVWLDREDVGDVGRKVGAKVVPVVGYGRIADAVDLCRRGFDSKIGDLRAEGIVMRPTVEMQDKQGRRIIAKLKARDFVAP